MSVLTRYASDSIDLVDLQDGKSRVTLQYFYVTGNDASAPASPSGNFTYTFSTGVLTTTGSFGDWTDNPDSLSLSETLWMVSITVEGFNTATFGASDWNGPVVLSRVGFQPTQPDPATSVATVFLYKAGSSSTTAPTGNPSGNFTYTFASGALSGGTLNGWSQTLPTVAPGNYVWVKQATASSTSTTDTIPASEFNASGATVLAGAGTDGVDGYNTAVVQLYKKNSSSSSAPTDPTGTFTYTFSTGDLSEGTFDGWTQSAPSITNGEYLWIIQASAVSRNDTDTIEAGEFGAAQIVGIGGEDGVTPPPLTVTDTDRDGQNQTITFSDGSSITITDGDDGTSEGVLVVYASNANGANKSLTRGNLQYVRYYEWQGTRPTLAQVPNTNNGWVKFIGENGDPATDQGIIAIYSSVGDPTSNSGLSLSPENMSYVNFYEWSGTKPTSVPNDAHTKIFVPFVAFSPTISTSTTNGVTTVTVTDVDGTRNFTVTDGDPGTSEGVAVIYADNAGGTNKNVVRQTGQEYVLYYEWVGIENKPNSDLSNLTGTLEWIKFVGETPDAPPAQGVVPVYSSVQNPSNMTPISLTLGTRKFVTFYEWSGSKPTQDSQLPSNLHQQTFVQFVADSPDAPDAPDAPDPTPKYATIRLFYAGTSSNPGQPSATITWSDLSISDITSDWSQTAPTVSANSTTVWWFSDIVFIDASGLTTETTKTGNGPERVVSFDGIVTFTNTGDSSGIGVTDGTTPATLLTPDSVASGGTTVINGGRIDANTMSLAAVADTSDSDGSMLLTSDLITINDASGNPRVLIGKLS